MQRIAPTAIMNARGGAWAQLARIATGACLGLLVWPAMVGAQTTTVGLRTAAVAKLDPRSVPPLMSQHVTALGDRLWTAGKERLVLSGVYTDASGDTPAQLVLQLPTLCWMSLATAKGTRTVVFDGSNAWMNNGQTDSAADDLLESFADDTAEGLISSAAKGANFALMGRRFLLSGPSAPKGSQQWVDIYTSLKPVVQRKEKAVSRKLYSFDSTTHLLVRVVYRDPSDGAAIETDFDGWGQIQGQAVPAQWTRKRNGTVVFRRTSAAIAAFAKDGTFSRQP